MKKVYIGFIIGLGVITVIGAIVSLFSMGEIRQYLMDILGPEYFDEAATVVTASDVVSTITSIAITSLFVTLACLNIAKDEKHTAVGVCLLLFSNLISGILYFIYFSKASSKVEKHESNSSGVNFCPNCGGKLDSDVIFCPHCGRKIDENSSLDE